MPRAIIIAPNWIGDAVMAQPLLALLKQQGFQIDVLATPWVAPVFKACAQVNQVIEADFKHGLLALGLRIQIANQLKTSSYDAAYVLPNSWKSALIPWLAKIPVRIGYRGEMRAGLLNRRLANPPKTNRPSMVKHYAALARLSSRSLAEIVVENPKLDLTNNVKLETQTLLTKLFPNQQEYFVLAPGAEYGPAKQWPLEHFAELAALLLDQFNDAGVVIIGGPKDKIASQQIIEALKEKYPRISSDRIKSTCGEISLTQSIALVSMSNGVASNDSGMMHVAAAFEVPQVAFFGSSDPKHTPPLSQFATPLWLGLDCSPCHKRQCPLGHLRCLKDIHPELAFTELVNQIIRKKG